MCLSCNCGDVNNDHGDARNITLNDLQAAASAANQPADQVLRNIEQGFQHAKS